MDTATKPRAASPLSDQWRRALAERQIRTDEPSLVELPSGLSVRATRPSLLLLLRSGRIPDVIAPQVEQFIATAQSGGEDAVRVALTNGQKDNPAAWYAEWVNLLDTVWLAAVVEPRFGPALSTDPELIPVDQVADDDKTFLFMWCQGVAEEVATAYFRTRARPDQAMDAAPTGDGVRTGPGGVAGDRLEA